MTTTGPGRARGKLALFSALAGMFILILAAGGPAARASASSGFDDQASQFNIFWDCSTPPCPQNGSVSDVASPSEDGDALNINYASGNQSYEGLDAYTSLGTDASAVRYQVNYDFYFPNRAPIQALEFCMNNYFGGQRYQWALQWENIGTGAPQWRLWTGSAWQAIGVSDNNINAGTWYTITIDGDIVGGQVHYLDFVIHGTTHSLTQYSFNPVPSSGPGLVAAVQVDGDSSADPYQVYVDNAHYYWSDTASTYASEQTQYLASQQLSDGAILGPGDSINPYFANLAAIGLARSNTSTGNTLVYNWMQWYLGHLNAKDSNGFADTIYDYTYNPSTGAETSTGSYDSVDSYAATALSLAYTGYLTGDSRIQALVSNNILTYEAIANLEDYSAPIGVRQSDGLTVAVPGGAQYTMDNSEVARGLSDFAQLEAMLGRSSQSTYYQNWASTSIAAITKPSSQGGLWNTANNNWDWALGSASNPAATFYPDATAQLWPVLFGVVTPGSSQASAAWNAFSGAYPSWYTDQIPDSFPWTAMARAGQLMGLSSQASTLLSTLQNKYAPGWAYPWYDAEAGWFLLAATTTSP